MPIEPMAPTRMRLFSIVQWEQIVVWIPTCPGLMIVFPEINTFE